MEVFIDWGEPLLFKSSANQNAENSHLWVSHRFLPFSGIVSGRGHLENNTYTLDWFTAFTQYSGPQLPGLILKYSNYWQLALHCIVYPYYMPPFIHDRSIHIRSLVSKTWQQRWWLRPLCLPEGRWHTIVIFWVVSQSGAWSSFANLRMPLNRPSIVIFWVVFDPVL